MPAITSNNPVIGNAYSGTRFSLIRCNISAVSIPIIPVAIAGNEPSKPSGSQGLVCAQT